MHHWGTHGYVETFPVLPDRRSQRVPSVDPCADLSRDARAELIHLAEPSLNLRGEGRLRLRGDRRHLSEKGAVGVLNGPLDLRKLGLLFVADRPSLKIPLCVALSILQFRSIALDPS